MTVLKCNRCGEVQKNPQSLKGWGEFQIAVYLGLGDVDHKHEHYCPKCLTEIKNWRFKAEIERNKLLRDGERMLKVPDWGNDKT